MLIVLSHTDDPFSHYVHASHESDLSSDRRRSGQKQLSLRQQRTYLLHLIPAGRRFLRHVTRQRMPKRHQPVPENLRSVHGVMLRCDNKCLRPIDRYSAPYQITPSSDH